MILPITNRSRKYGYVIWPKSADAEVRALLSDAKRVEVQFNGTSAGEKSVDWKHRRISIGRKLTGSLPENTTEFVLDVRESTLTVTPR